MKQFHIENAPPPCGDRPFQTAMSQTDTQDSQADDGDRYIVPGLVRGLRILCEFSDKTPEMGVAEISRRINVGRSTAWRLVYTLEHAGFLQKVPGTKKYQLGMKVLDLGFRFLSELDIIEIAKPHLQMLRDQTESSSHLAILDGRDIVYVARHNAKARVTSNVGVGTRFPAHATSSGRMLLSSLQTTEIVSLFEGVELDRFTDTTPTTLGDLINLLDRDRKAGYVLSWGAFERNLASIAAPVYDSTGAMVASINISCPITTHSKKEFETAILEQVLACGETISKSLGYAA